MSLVGLRRAIQTTVSKKVIASRCPPQIEIPLSIIRSQLCSLHNCHDHYTLISHSELLTLSRRRSLRVSAANKNPGYKLIPMSPFSDFDSDSCDNTCHVK